MLIIQNIQKDLTQHLINRTEQEKNLILLELNLINIKFISRHINESFIITI